MKNKHNWLILSATLSATLSANAKEYVVNLHGDVQQVLEVDLIDTTGNPSPLYTNRQMNVDHNVMRGYDIFHNYKVSSNVPGIEFEISRHLSPLAMPAEVDPFFMRAILSASKYQSTCDENVTEWQIEKIASQEINLPTSTLSEGGRLCRTGVYYGYWKKLPAGIYQSWLKLGIKPKL